MIDLNKRMIDMTARDFLELMEQGNKPQLVIDTTVKDKQYVYGLAGIAELFGCSKTTASRLKQSGKIKNAITQVGNLIIVDADKALKLAGEVNGKNSKKRLTN